jgi:hypothetical protein
VCE